jgi:hypothetical protein
VLIGPELANGVLVAVSPFRRSGYGFYIACRAGHPKTPSITAFADSARHGLTFHYIIARSGFVDLHAAN